MSNTARAITATVLEAGPSCPPVSIEGEMSTLGIGSNECDGEDLLNEDLTDLKSEPDLVDLSSEKDSKTIKMTSITEQMALPTEQVAADNSVESKTTVSSDATILVDESEPSLPAAAESSLPSVPNSAVLAAAESSVFLTAEPTSLPVVTVVTEPHLKLLTRFTSAVAEVLSGSVTEPAHQMPKESSPSAAAEPAASVTVPTADAKPEEKGKKPSSIEARIQSGLVPRIRPRKIGTSGDVILAGHVGESQVIHVVTPIERFLCNVRTKTSDGYRFIAQEPDRYVLEKPDEKTAATTEGKDEITNSGDKPKEEGTIELNKESSQTTTGERELGVATTDVKDEVSQLDNEPKHETAATEANNEILQPETDLINLTDPDSQTGSSTPDEDTPTTSQAVDNDFFPEAPPAQDSLNTDANANANADATPPGPRIPFKTFPPPIPRDPSSGRIKYNYQSYFEIKESPVGGLGAFAVKDLYKGDIILMEAPILRTTGFNLFKDFRALDTETREIFLSLHAVEEDGVNKIERIRRANAFEIPSGIAILAIGSRFNHGCGAKRSVSYTYDAQRNTMVFEIVADFVPSGQELFVTYGGTPAQLFRTFGFRCRCGGCDGLRDEDIRRLRAEERGEWYFDRSSSGPRPSPRPSLGGGYGGGRGRSRNRNRSRYGYGYHVAGGYDW